MSVLLIAEHNNKEVRPFTYNAITAASQINEDLHVLVLGHQADDVAKSLSEVPIFSVADYGLEADLFEALPQFLSELNKLNTIQK